MKGIRVLFLITILFYSCDHGNYKPQVDRDPCILELEQCEYRINYIERELFNCKTELDECKYELNELQDILLDVEYSVNDIESLLSALLDVIYSFEAEDWEFYLHDIEHFTLTISSEIDQLKNDIQ